MAKPHPEAKVKLDAYSDAQNLRSFLKGQIFGTITPVTESNITKPEIRGRTIIVTGANTGLGLEAAKQFAELACVSRLILACRSASKGNAAREAILATLPSEKGSQLEIYVWELDMASKASIVAFTERTRRELDHVDAIVLNAGVDLVSYQKAKDEDGGYEMTVMVNVVGTMMLAVLIIPVLREKARPGLTPRITFVGSAVQFLAKHALLVEAEQNQSGEGIMQWLSTETRWKNKIGEDRYNLSKVMLQMLVHQLAARYPVSGTQNTKKGMIVNCAAPGYCKTELFRTAGTAVSRVALRLIGREAEVGARSLLVGAVGQEGDVKSHGMYMTEGTVKGVGSAWLQTEQGKRIEQQLWTELMDEVVKSVPTAESDL
ncbi:hypothetical protein LTR64_008295 [Lithohypha guttulata]|uniref:uncharacterized protein n=1 Tax=Lithohypha guttulata TaxID=1690604 RepID=UPI002DDEC192|nr:hypothetical protein LTR51_008447 [Lithohypha guttulata]